MSWIPPALHKGLGLAVGPAPPFTDKIEAAVIEQVLVDFEPMAMPIKTVHPNFRLAPSRVQAIVDYLIEAFERDPRLGGS